MGLVFYAYLLPISSLLFLFLLPSLHSVYGYINSIVDTCHALVERESFIFCHYLWNSWDGGLDLFSVATTKCTGLKSWSNFGLLFCLICQFFYNCGRSFAGNQCLHIEDFFFLWQKVLGDAFDRHCWTSACCSTHISSWWRGGQMWAAKLKF